MELTSHWGGSRIQGSKGANELPSAFSFLPSFHLHHHPMKAFLRGSLFPLRARWLPRGEGFSPPGCCPKRCQCLPGASLACQHFTGGFSLWPGDCLALGHLFFISGLGSSRSQMSAKLHSRNVLCLLCNHLPPKVGKQVRVERATSF